MQLSTYESTQSSQTNDSNDSIKSINQLNIFICWPFLVNLLFRWPFFENVQFRWPFLGNVPFRWPFLLGNVRFRWPFLRYFESIQLMQSYQSLKVKRLSHLLHENELTQPPINSLGKGIKSIQTICGKMNWFKSINSVDLIGIQVWLLHNHLLISQLDCWGPVAIQQLAYLSLGSMSTRSDRKKAFWKFKTRHVFMLPISGMSKTCFRFFNCLLSRFWPLFFI